MSEKELFQKYGAQLGEIAWHSIVVDERIDEITTLREDPQGPYRVEAFEW